MIELDNIYNMDCLEGMKHSQAYKDFQQAVSETTDSTDSTDF